MTSKSFALLSLGLCVTWGVWTILWCRAKRISWVPWALLLPLILAVVATALNYFASPSGLVVVVAAHAIPLWGTIDYLRTRKNGDQ